jgi:hypothetical protein
MFLSGVRHFTIATTLHHKMDMRFWLEQAEAEMKGMRVPACSVGLS